jgi:predicted RNA-binding protein with PUA-like domain
MEKIMNHWLMKSEPEEFSIDDLQKRDKKTEHWDGVRNYQARNMMRDQMKKGDLVFFYHSNCDEPGIVGIMKVFREGYPDFTAFDPKDAHYDPKSDPENPRWFMVDVRHVRKLKRTISLKELKTYDELHEMPLVKKGNRLSVMPVSEDQWNFILQLEKK